MIVRGRGDDNDFISQTESLECMRSPLQNPTSAGVTSQKSGGGPIRLHHMRRERTFQSSLYKGRESILRGLRRTIGTDGSRPKYNYQDKLFKPLVIGICGGSASGKTVITRKIIEKLDIPKVNIL